ncbi:MAG: hypothetical protein M5R36_07905 [Deltaproteobacteria bacterium]|nr:hypothetical protein [Deltaproteobacteria bacterium]
MSVALDRQGRAHAAYDRFVDLSTTALGYGTRGLLGWSFEEPFFNMDLPSLVLDDAGAAHLVATDFSSILYAPVLYVTNENGTWTAEEVRPGGEPGGHYLDIAWSPEGLLIASQEEYTASAYASIQSNGTWMTETVDTAPTVEYPSLAFDGDGAAHVVFKAWSENKIVYQTNRSGEWEQTVWEFPGTIRLRRQAIAADASGHAAFVYRDPGNSALWFVTNESGTWASEAMPITGNFAGSYPLAMGSDGKYRAVFESPNDVIVFAVRDGGTWTTDAVDAGSVATDSVSFALDADDLPHIAFTDGAVWEILQYATNASGTWEIEEVSGTPKVKDQLSVAWSIDRGSTGITYVQQESYGEVEVYYAFRNDGSWANAKITDDEGWAFYPVLVFDEDSDPIILYYYTLSGIMIATSVDGNWLLEEFDAWGNEVGSVKFQNNDLMALYNTWPSLTLAQIPGCKTGRPMVRDARRALTHRVNAIMPVFPRVFSGTS